MRFHHLFFAAGLLNAAWLSTALAADEEKTASDGAASVVDLLKGAIDPFDEGPERARFLRTAGKDGELDEADFTLDRDSGEGFVRAFDQWTLISRFDVDHDKTINWIEAHEYRRAILTVLLAKHDTNRDNKLIRAERDRANDALARNELGRYFGDVKTGIAAARQERPPTEEVDDARARRRAALWRRANIQMGLPPEHDGNLTAADVATIRRIRKERWQRQYVENVKAVLTKYDDNGNGRLDPDESDEYKRNRIAGFQNRYINGAGVLDRDAWEASPIKGFFDRHSRYDLDGDGLLNAEENEAMTRESEEKANRRGQAFYEWLREPGHYRDINQDGKVDPDDFPLLVKEFDSTYRDSKTD